MKSEHIPDMMQALRKAIANADNHEIKPTFQVHEDLRPAPAEKTRLSESVMLELATQELERTKQILSMPCYGPPVRPGGKPRRLSIRDRDAMLVREISAVLAELSRSTRDAKAQPAA